MQLPEKGIATFLVSFESGIMGLYAGKKSFGSVQLSNFPINFTQENPGKPPFLHGHKF